MNELIELYCERAPKGVISMYLYTFTLGLVSLIMYMFLVYPWMTQYEYGHFLFLLASTYVFSVPPSLLLYFIIIHYPEDEDTETLKEMFWVAQYAPFFLSVVWIISLPDIVMKDDIEG